MREKKSPPKARDVREVTRPHKPLLVELVRLLARSAARASLGLPGACKPIAMPTDEEPGPTDEEPGDAPKE